MKRILLTGANRGLGLEFTRQFAARGDRVFAAARHPEKADALQKLADAHPDNITLVKLEVTDPASRDAAYAQIAEQTDALDLLLNNAGIFNKFKSNFGSGGTDPKFGELTAENLAAVYDVNAVAPVMMAQRFVDLLSNGKRPVIANMSSLLGSIGLKSVGGYYAYSAAKAALNMYTRLLAHDLAGHGITVVSLHPGWVQTDMGGPRAPVKPADSIGGLIRVLDGVTRKQSGKFFTYEGDEMEW